MCHHCGVEDAPPRDMRQLTSGVSGGDRGPSCGFGCCGCGSGWGVGCGEPAWERGSAWARLPEGQERHGLLGLWAAAWPDRLCQRTGAVSSRGAMPRGDAARATGSAREDMRGEGRKR